MSDVLGDLAITIVKGPAGVLAGIVYGFIVGILLWFIPSKDSVCSHMFYFILIIKT